MQNDDNQTKSGSYFIDGQDDVLGSVDESVVRLAAAVVIELALYGELFTAGAYAPGFRPWDGRSSARVAGMRAPEGNKTPVVRQEVLQPMLAAALYLAGTIGPRIAALAFADAEPVDLAGDGRLHARDARADPWHGDRRSRAITFGADHASRAWTAARLRRGQRARTAGVMVLRSTSLRRSRAACDRAQSHADGARARLCAIGRA